MHFDPDLIKCAVLKPVSLPSRKMHILQLKINILNGRFLEILSRNNYNN